MDAKTLESFRQLIEQQNRKIDELTEKVHQLEARQTQTEVIASAPRLPTIVIDTNGVPVGTLAAAESETNAPGKATALLMAGANGFLFRSADTNFVLILHGLVQADSRTFLNDHPLSVGNDGFLLRRARPIIEGTVFRDCDFLIVPDFAGSQAQLFDASVTYRFAPEVQLKAGKFKGPVSLENLQTDAAAPFNERSLASDLVPMRNVGLQLGGELAHGSLSWGAGIFSGDGDGRLAGNSPFNDDLEFGGRLFWQPGKSDPDSLWHGLGLGVGGSYSDVTSNSAALSATTGGTLPGYWSSGQQQFFAYNPSLGPVVADGPHWRLSPQATYYRGPFGVQGEYVFSDQGVFNATTWRSARLLHTAWQVSAQWVLTGESASFNALTPIHPFDFRAGHWGAWQLVARYSQLDLDDNTFNGFANASTSARSAAAWSLGLNWWLNANVRWLTSFSHTTFQGGGGVNLLDPNTTTAPATVSAQDENALFTRIQIAF